MSDKHWKKSKRLEGLKKKIGELLVLCDIEGFMIIEAEDGDVYKWPEDEQKFLSLVEKYRRGPRGKNNEYLLSCDGNGSVTKGSKNRATPETAKGRRKALQKKRRLTDNEAIIDGEESGLSRKKRRIEESEAVSADPHLSAVVLQKLLARISDEVEALDKRIDYLKFKEWQEVIRKAREERAIADAIEYENSLTRKPSEF